MATSMYTINKGINRPLEFKGLRAQYIAYLAIGLVILLLLFALLYLAGVSPYGCLLFVFGAGAALFAGVYHINRVYGRYGLLKKLARRSLPVCLRVTSRKSFLSLQPSKQHDGSTC